MNETSKILFVDDDEKLLGGIIRQQGDDFDLSTASSGRQALELIERDGPFAVVVSDMRMPEMNGIELLKHVRQVTPDTVRMMLTGFAELNTTIDAINEGNIFRFLAKPCGAVDLANALRAALRQYRLIRAEKELVEGTLQGSVKVLSEVLSLVCPLAFGQSIRVRAIVDGMLKHVAVDDQWQLEIAALLSSLGCVTIPDEILERKLTGETVDFDSEKLFERHPKLAADLIQAIPRMDHVAKIIFCQDADQTQPSLEGVAVPPESRILKLAIDYDRCESQSESPLHALNELREHRDAYDGKLFDALEKYVRSEKNYECARLNVHEITQGMVLADDIRNQGGTLLMSKGQRLTGSAIRLLENYFKNKSLSGMIKVIIPRSEGAPDVVRVTDVASATSVAAFAACPPSEIAP